MVDREPLVLPCHLWVIKCPVPEVEVPSTLTQWHRERMKGSRKSLGLECPSFGALLSTGHFGYPTAPQAPSLSGTFVCFLAYGLHMLWCPHCLVQVSDSVEGFIKSPALVHPFLPPVLLLVGNHLSSPYIPTSCVTLGKWYSFSLPQISPLQNVTNNRSTS